MLSSLFASIKRNTISEGTSAPFRLTPGATDGHVPPRPSSLAPDVDLSNLLSWLFEAMDSTAVPPADAPADASTSAIDLGGSAVGGRSRHRKRQRRLALSTLAMLFDLSSDDDGGDGDDSDTKKSAVQRAGLGEMTAWGVEVSPHPSIHTAQVSINDDDVVVPPRERPQLTAQQREAVRRFHETTKMLDHELPMREDHPAIKMSRRLDEAEPWANVGSFFKMARRDR